MNLKPTADASDFYNLNFDQANANHLSDAPGIPGGRQGTATDLLPGWSFQYDGHPYTGPIFYSFAPIAQPSIIHASEGIGYVNQYFF